MAIQLITFGGLHAIDEAGGLDRLLGQHSRAALFVFLAVERRVSRESLTAIFWPESDAENARHALRQSLYHLRKAAGADWIESLAHELVVTGNVRTDASDFTAALERDDLASAVELYRGPFLDGVHLVDLQAWESWVDARRAQYARAFRKACRELIEVGRADGDATGMIRIAERWAARDPMDDEAQHRLIESLAVAGERTEALRQYETFARRLESDGLEAPDETLQLVARLRSDSSPLPTLRAADPVQPAPPVGERATPSVAPPDVGVRRSMPLRGTARRPARRWLMAAAVLTVLPVLTTFVWQGRRPPERPPSFPATIAVLPFTVRGGGAVDYLGDGIVNLLGAALDGAGAWRPADARATFAAVREAGGAELDAQSGNRVATRLRAGMFVLGDVVQAGGQLQIEAAVYNAGGGCGLPSQANTLAECAAPEPMTKAVVSGALDSVFTLVDRLAARLLGGLGLPAGDRLVRSAALTTTSLPAFKSYLQGEALMRAGQFEKAADTYLAAIAEDSAFAVAHYRLALAREWAPLPGEDSAANAAARHGARLLPRDHALLDAFRRWRAGDAIGAEQAYRRILKRYPDDIDAWFQLGEILFHHGPLLGRPIAESEEAWRKVLAYEPKNLFALTHVARIAVLGQRLAAVDSLLAPFTPEELRTDRRLVEIVLLRAVARRDTADARVVAMGVRQWEPFAVWRTAVFLTAFSPNDGLMRSVMQDLAADFPTPFVRADLLWFASMLDLAGGRTGAAEATRLAAVEAERRAPVGRRRPGFDLVTQWYAATLPLPYADSMLARVRREAASRQRFPIGVRAPFETELGLGAPIQLESLRHYTLGILSLRLRDTVAATAAAKELERLAAAQSATGLTRDLDRGLRARQAFLAGRPHDALRLLDALEARDSQGEVAVIPFVSRASERFLRAEVLAALGRNDEAVKWLAALGDGSASEIPLRAVSHLRRAEILERLGNREEAARQQALARAAWHDADPAFRSAVTGVNQRPARR